MAAPTLLYCMPFSHFNERARFALDVCGQAFRTRAVMPLLHMPLIAFAHAWYGIKPASHGGKKISSSLSTPLLVFPGGGGGVNGSGDILRWAAARAPAASPPLFPAGLESEVAAVEDLAHDTLGPAVRIIAYYHLLPDVPLMRELATRNNVGWVQRMLWCWLTPLWIAGLRRALSITEERAAAATARVRRVFEEVSARLDANARARDLPLDSVYIVGPNFTAADLTFAALAAPILGIGPVDGFGGWVPSMDSVAPPLRALALELRGTCAGRHVLRIYAQHRKAPAVA